MKVLLIIFSYFIISARVYAQNKASDIFFIADTTSSTPANSFLPIQREGSFDTYIFYCRCIRANESIYTCFYYDTRKANTETFAELPKFKYLSWKELESLLYEKQRTFDQYYALHIIEKLPDGSYKKNKVKLAQPNPRTTSTTVNINE